MEHALTCNNLKCRAELGDRALVTTCSHIFCLDCAQRLGVTGQEAPRQVACPACNSQLTNADDAVITNLNPSEDYKTSVLSGLSPNVIMECAGRALSFWAYQTTQDIYYQQYLYKTLADKYSSLSIRLDRTVNDANSEIEGLQHRLGTFASEQDALRRKNEELSQAYREKSRKLLQTQELYDKVKRKAEMGHIQRAASDAVDSSILSAPQGASHMLNGLGTNDAQESRDNNDTVLGQGRRFDATGMNTAVTRSALHHSGEKGRWPRLGPIPRYDAPGTPILGTSLHQRVEESHSLGGTAGHSGLGAPPASMTGSNRSVLGTNAPSFAHNRGGLAGVGLTSGLRGIKSSGKAHSRQGRKLKKKPRTRPNDPRRVYHHSATKQSSSGSTVLGTETPQVEELAGFYHWGSNAKDASTSPSLDRGRLGRREEALGSHPVSPVDGSSRPAEAEVRPPQDSSALGWETNHPAAVSDGHAGHDGNYPNPEAKGTPDQLGRQDEQTKACRGGAGSNPSTERPLEPLTNLGNESSEMARLRHLRVQVDELAREHPGSGEQWARGGAAAEMDAVDVIRAAMQDMWYRAEWYETSYPGLRAAFNAAHRDASLW